MLGGNGNWFTANWKKGLIVLVLTAMAAAGVAVPMNAIDNTNEAQDVSIGDINTWRADFYDVEWPAHLKVFGTLSDDFGTHLLAYTDYTELNDQNIVNINEDIAVLDAWVTAFYNDDEEALGEWQLFLEDWEAFLVANEAAWAAQAAAWSSWYSSIVSRLAELES